MFLRHSLPHAQLLPSAYAMLQWACAKTGAILVTINPAYRIRELVGA
jgi:acyl-CoA synthetase (AMP-forming)/AMP-acid ligase II